MKEPTAPGATIPRRRPGEKNDFERLSEEGLELIVAVSGNLWTDYNLHDPGITLLEAFCYALTDLQYRADFTVEDHLADEDGRIAFPELALHRPEVILSSRPATTDDYRRWIVGSVPDVEDAWVEASDRHPRSAPDGLPKPPGVYSVRVRLAKEVRGTEAVRSRVRSAFSARRNLGEDLDAEVKIAELRECELQGQVEIQGPRVAEDILADIYMVAERYVAAEGAAVSYASLIASGRSLEEIFTGPFTGRELKATSRDEGVDKVHMADLVTLINAIEGVVAVPDLALVTDGDVHRDSVDRVVDDRVLSLHVPRVTGEAGSLRLVQGGRRHVAGPGFWNKYQELRAAHRRLSRMRIGLSSLYEEPRGSPRDVERYRSIQEDLPAIYGVNAAGVPDGAPLEVKARAAQLKGYLLPMEQIMADYLANVGHLRNLFSTSDSSGRTYWYQVLDDGVIPGVDGLYRQPAEAFLDRLAQSMTDHLDRKSRVLDHMLAAFGETFPDDALRSFDGHHGSRSAAALAVRRKLRFLSEVVEVGRDRVGGFDTTRPAWVSGEENDSPAASNPSGFQRRVGLLLGFEHVDSRSLADPLTERGLHLVPHREFVDSTGQPILELVDLDDSYDPVPEHATGARLDVDALRKVVAPLRTNLLSDRLFVHGVDLDRYRLGRRGDRHVLALRGERDDEWWYLGDYPSEAAGQSAAEALRRFLLEANARCEGLHVVEHILLRPSGEEELHRGVVAAPGHDLWDDFYPLRISVVFPAWTVRCREERFRRLAEETVRLTCPAHVHPECYWLDVGEMEEFERVYQRWLGSKVDPTETPEAKDEAAVPLIRLVLDWQAHASGGGISP